MSLEQVDFLSMVFYITYVLVNPISVYIIENKGIRCSLILGVLTQVVGFWVRAMIDESFVYCLVG